MSGKIVATDLVCRYGTTTALRGVSLTVPAHQVTSIIGPARSGKTTFLRILNRLIVLDDTFTLAGRVTLDGADLFRLDLTEVRRRIGMIFALPIPLPLTVFDNVAYGPRLKGIRSHARLAALVERSLRQAILWDEVKDRLADRATRLSGGQQQRLCIARALAAEPEVILMDEPCSGLDPISTAKVEQAISELKRDYTIIFVTNNTKQAARISDQVAFFLSGELVETGAPDQFFTTPRDKRTDDYLSGRFG